MNAALGYGFTMLGLVVSIFGCLVGIYALINERERLIGQVRNWSWFILVAGIGAFTVMQVALFQRDYTVSFVQLVGSETTPALFNFAAIWSALEGSILLWTLVLAIYISAVVVKFRKRGNDPLLGWAMVVLFGISAFFFALMAGPANPCLLYTSPSPRDRTRSRMPSSA